MQTAMASMTMEKLNWKMWMSQFLQMRLLLPRMYMEIPLAVSKQMRAETTVLQDWNPAQTTPLRLCPQVVWICPTHEFLPFLWMQKCPFRTKQLPLVPVLVELVVQQAQLSLLVQVSPALKFQVSLFLQWVEQILHLLPCNIKMWLCTSIMASAVMSGRKATITAHLTDSTLQAPMLLVSHLLVESL